MTFPDSREANRRFGLVFRAITQRSVDTTTFRKLTVVGMPLAELQVHGQFRRFVEDLAAGPEFEQYFVNRDLTLDFYGGTDGMAASMASRQLDAYQASVDAASIVFAHSALDAAVSDLCWAIAFAAPADWEDYVTDRKVSLSQAKGSSFEVLFGAKLTGYLTELERESMLTRVDRLFMLCRPDPDFEGIKGFRFDRDRVERLDALRHDVVHHEVELGAFNQVDDDVRFMFNAALHIWGIVHARYDLKIDVRDLVTLPRTAEMN